MGPSDRLPVWLGFLLPIALAPGFLSDPPGAAAAVSAESSTPVPLLEIELSFPEVWKQVQGLDLDFIEVRPGFRTRVLGWPSVADRLRAAGIEYRVVSPDFGRELALRNGAVRSPGSEVGGPPTTASPAASIAVPPAGQGSLAGFWTFAEVASLLDSLAALYGGTLVTGVDTIGWSLEARPILALGVTDLTRPLGTRPEVLYTSLTHAREPQGMQVVLHFLLELLEGYGTDPEITYLVQERELWFIPVVNPDGYVRNQNTWDTTGAYGFWRKNLRNNDQNPGIGGNDGVDLNRNFGFQWGYDDAGSSPAISSPIYRGAGPFSEPEARAVRDFCLVHAVRTAQNYHTYFELCLYSWGYLSADTPDSPQFIRIADAMAGPARYGYGRSGQVLYPVNGEANDWMYGDPVKPSTLAFTTEVGNQNDGFWPPASRIAPLAEAHLRANIVLAYAASVYLTADSLVVDGSEGVLLPGTVRPLRSRLRHDGISDPTDGPARVRVASLTPGISLINDVAEYPALSPGGAAWPVPGDAFIVRADPEVIPGTPASLLLEIADQGAYVGLDTLTFRVGEPLIVLEEDAESGLAEWITQGTWGLESKDGSTVFSDSPGGSYLTNVDASLTLNHALDLSGAVHAVLRFRTLWDIEMGFDFARIEASSDSGTTWTALAGHHTRSGHGTVGGYAGGTQPSGIPGYDGNQRVWEAEEVDLGAFAGLPDVRLRIRMTSDVGVEQDGWHLDDLVLAAYAPGVPLAVGPEGPRRHPFLAVSPNPLSTESRIGWSLENSSAVRLAVHDVTGREVRVLTEGLAGPGRREATWDGRDASGRPVASGAYFVRLETPSGTRTAKLLVVR